MYRGQNHQFLVSTYVKKQFYVEFSVQLPIQIIELPTRLVALIWTLIGEQK